MVIVASRGGVLLLTRLRDSVSDPHTKVPGEIVVGNDQRYHMVKPRDVNRVRRRLAGSVRLVPLLTPVPQRTEPE